MKKSLILLGMISIGYANAQSTDPYEGKVGINTTKPEATLDVKSKTGTTGATKNLELQNANGAKLVTVLDDGKVGIGMVPSDRLEVNGNAVIYGSTTSYVNSNEGGRLILSNATKQGAKEVISWGILNMTNKNTTSGSKYTNGLHFWGYRANGDHSSRMVLTDKGNLGIGFSSEPDTEIDHLKEKLEVNGNIRSTSLSGTGDRAVYADANGVLKIGTANTALKATDTTEQCTDAKAGTIHYKEVEVSGVKKGIFGFCTKHNGAASWVYLSNGGNILQGTGAFGEGL